MEVAMTATRLSGILLRPDSANGTIPGDSRSEQGQRAQARLVETRQGHGGVAVEVIDDKALAIPSLGLRLAYDLIGSTRVARIWRGSALWRSCSSRGRLLPGQLGCS